MLKKPVIQSIRPQAALPGGEVHLEGDHFMEDARRATVSIDNLHGHVVACSENHLVVAVPSNAHQGIVRVLVGEAESEPVRVVVASLITGNLHPVSNPAIDREGNIFATFSGARGQKVETSVFKIKGNEVTPYLSELMNPTGIAFNSKEELFISSRYDGSVYRVLSSTNLEVYAKGMGVATGIVFDPDDNLYVGDRSGTIFKIDKERRTFVFATIEPSVSAYHLALDAQGSLYVSGPTIGCFDTIYRVSQHGDVDKYFSGLGRPQGMAFDPDGNLLVAASFAGQRGVVRIIPDRQASLVVSGTGIVGMAFDRSAPGSLVLATIDSLYRLNFALMGRPLTN